MARTRLAMVLPGATSLGAYEGGALAALLVALQHAEGEVVIDAIASASAGSITGLLTASCLLRGGDPVDLMADAWVTLPSLGNLRSDDPDAPLSTEALRAQAATLLSGDLAAAGPPVQSEPVRLSMALCSLGGLTYEIASVERTTTVEAATHLDWFDVTFHPSDGTAAYLAAVEGAMASAANALGFLPVGFDRSGEPYAAAGLENPGFVWFTDGGTVDNEPFGRAIDLFAGIDAGADGRALVFVDPTPSTADRGSRWFRPGPPPAWLRTGLRTYGLLQAHSYYEDLRRLEKVNARLAWLGGVLDRVQRGLDGALEGVDPAAAAAVRHELDAAVAGAAAWLDEEQNEIRRRAGRPERRDPAGSLPDLVRRAAGLEGKEAVRVEVVSPRLSGDGRSAEDQLAGEFLGSFGGFLDEDFRRNDFALGYRNVQTWLHGWLPEAAPVHAEGALAAVQARWAALGWDDVDEGAAGLGTLTLGEDLDLVRLTAHVARVAAHDLRHWND